MTSDEVIVDRIRNFEKIGGSLTYKSVAMRDQHGELASVDMCSASIFGFESLADSYTGAIARVTKQVNEARFRFYTRMLSKIA